MSNRLESGTFEGTAKVDTIYSQPITDSVFTGGIEGPATNSNGDLFVVNWDHEGTIGVLRKDSQHFELYVELPEGSIGNGIKFDAKGQMYVADYKGHNILKIDPNTQEISVFAHEPKMNQPNDVALFDPEKLIFFASDPNWGMKTGNLWRIEEGKAFLVDSTLGTSNGVAVSTDKHYLYVNESIQRKIWRYDLDVNGNISNKTLFYEFLDAGMDGMRCDFNNNLYVARYDAGEVVVIAPNATVIKVIKLNGQKPTNVAFSPEHDRLYITMQQKKWVEVAQLK